MAKYNDLKKVPGDIADLAQTGKDIAIGSVVDKVTESAAGLADEALGTNVIKPIVQTVNLVGDCQNAARVCHQTSRLVKHLSP